MALWFTTGEGNTSVAKCTEIMISPLVLVLEKMFQRVREFGEVYVSDEDIGYDTFHICKQPYLR